MQFRRLISVTLFAAGALAGPRAAAAQSLNPAFIPPSDNGPSYVLDEASGTLSFGDGLTGETPSADVAANYGAGATGNLGDAWPTELLGCLVFGC